MRWWLLVVLCSCDWLLGLKHFPPGPDAPPPGAWAHVAVGSRHVCALDRDGHLSCWGDSRETGLAAPSLVPARVDDTTWTAVSVGAFHTCAISDRNVSCWGSNGGGQVNGTPGADVATPMRVNLPIGTPPVDVVAAGAFHTCAIAGGQLWCWGDPASTGTTGPSPKQVGAGTTWRSVATGYGHTCAIDDAGMVGCWGVNNLNQAPSTVVLPAAATAIAAGLGATCAIAAGQLWCWGNNSLLHPGMSGGAAPMQELDGNDWTDVAVGNHAVCGIRAGTANCWGVAYAGGFGDGVWFELVLPPATARAITADAIALSRSSDNDESACAISNGNITCWGENYGGQLGTLATLHLAPYTFPQQPASWDEVAAGETFTCARDTDHHAWCWGGDDVGQISGTACTLSSCDQPLPSVANAGAAIDQIIAGLAFTCMRSGSTFTCRGANDLGQLGVNDPAQHEHAVTINAATGGTGGYRATCATITGMPSSCWGAINSIPQPAPLAVAGLPEAPTIRFGRTSSSALTPAGSRWYWGRGYYGDLGDGVAHPATAGLTPPTDALDGVWSRMAFEDDHACGIKAGKILCFGTNYEWESDPTTNNAGFTPTPTTILLNGTPLTGCTAVAVGSLSSCGICNSTPYCWGFAQYGLLGRGRDYVNQQAADVVAVPPGHTWLDIVASSSHACALAIDGTLACWGTSVRGEIGDGSHGSNVPVAMLGPPS